MFGDNDIVTVPDSDLDADDTEAWRTVDDDLGDEDTCQMAGIKMTI